MSEASALNNILMVEICKRFPLAIVWRQNTGAGVGWSIVKVAVGLIRKKKYEEAIRLLLSRMIRWGTEGAGDLSGIFPIHIGGKLLGIRMEIETKIDDKQSDDQKGFELSTVTAGAIYIKALTVEQCIADLEAWRAAAERADTSCGRPK